MRSCNVDARGAHTSACGALALLLAACVTPPTLTLAASSSWRTRRDHRALAHAWTAGAALGWSAETRTDAAPEWTEAAAEDAAGRADPAAPCVFDSTCSWERGARSAALQRAQHALDGESP
jgi:hypothetical protein